MNILIPMAGRGSRFEAAGYTFPKPLIDVDGKPMIQVVTESLGVEGRYIFLVLRDHLCDYALTDLFDRIAPDHVIVPVDGVTEGAACTALLARDFIDDGPLLIANSDQLIEWDHALPDADGVILTFRATHPKWSYVREEQGRVVEVAEKRPISDKATCGVYWFRQGSDFVNGADAMIAQERRVNGEFYIAPVFNELIERGRTVVSHDVTRMVGLGTPEDLEAYIGGAR